MKRVKGMIQKKRCSHRFIQNLQVIYYPKFWSERSSCDPVNPSLEMEYFPVYSRLRWVTSNTRRWCRERERGFMKLSVQFVNSSELQWIEWDIHIQGMSQIDSSTFWNGDVDSLPHLSHYKIQIEYRRLSHSKPFECNCYPHLFPFPFCLFVSNDLSAMSIRQQI